MDEDIDYIISLNYYDGHIKTYRSQYWHISPKSLPREPSDTDIIRRFTDYP